MPESVSADPNTATVYRTLFEQASVGVVLFDIELRVTACNPAAVQIFQTTTEKIVGLDLRLLREAKFVPMLERAIGGESLVIEGPYSVETSAARILLVFRLTPLRDNAGAIVGGMAMVEDVTERRRAEDALRRSEARFRTVIEHGPDAVGVFRAGVRIYANRALAKFLGFSHPSEITGLTVREFIHPDDRAVFDVRMATRPMGVAMPPQEYRVTRPDGEVRSVEITSMAIDYDGAPAVICFLRDTTERRQLQLQLLQADRLVSVGTLAAGVAHEINNPLAYLMANLEMILSRRIPSLRGAVATEDESSPIGLNGAAIRQQLDDVESMVSTALEGAERVKEIVRDLKTFSRADTERRVPVDVRPVLDAAVNMAWNEIVHRARLVKEYEDVPAVYANESRLGQVFLNLLVNAAQSLPAGNAPAHQIKVRASTDSAGRVVVEVTDTGAGIPPEHLRRIFDPFFTTKPVGVGTGLGLSICQGIVTSLGGTIEVVTRVGRGTTFRVVIPQCTEAESVATDAFKSVATSQRRGRVLVIENDPAVANVLGAALSDDHDVAVACGGREGLALLEQDAAFDLVLCDLMMPDLTGVDVWNSVARTWPIVADRMVFVTGGVFSPREREFIDKTEVKVIEKPVDIGRLRELVRSRIS